MCLETGDGSSNTPWLHCSTRSLRPLELTLRKKSRNAFWNPAAQRSREAAPPNLHTAVNHGPNHGGSSLDVVCHGRVYEFNVSNKLAPKLLHVISGGGGLKTSIARSPACNLGGRGLKTSIGRSRYDGTAKDLTNSGCIANPRVRLRGHLRSVGAAEQDADRRADRGRARGAAAPEQA